MANIKWDSQRARKKGRKEPLSHLQRKEEDQLYPLQNQEAQGKIPYQRIKHQDKVASLVNETKAQEEEVSLSSLTKIRNKAASHANEIKKHHSQGPFLAFPENQENR